MNDYIYAGIITPSIHYCMGGVTMNENGELIKTDGKIMNGLFGQEKLLEDFMEEIGWEEIV